MGVEGALNRIRCVWLASLALISRTVQSFGFCIGIRLFEI